MNRKKDDIACLRITGEIRKRTGIHQGFCVEAEKKSLRVQVGNGDDSQVFRGRNQEALIQKATDALLK